MGFELRVIKHKAAGTHPEKPHACARGAADSAGLHGAMGGALESVEPEREVCGADQADRVGPAARRRALDELPPRGHRALAVRGARKRREEGDAHREAEVLAGARVRVGAVEVRVHRLSLDKRMVPSPLCLHRSALGAKRA